MAALGRHPKATLFLGESLLNISIALCLDWSVMHSSSNFGRFLNSRPMIFIGAMSYSIYLWQQILLNRNLITTVTAFPLNLGLVIIAALASYFLVEQPSLRFRQYWEKHLFPSLNG